MTTAAAPTMTSITPFFIVRDVEPTVAFYRDRLGFEVAFLAPYVHVEDPDALAAAVTARGAALRAPLANTQDGLRGFEVEDPDGHVLFFGRPE